MKRPMINLYQDPAQFIGDMLKFRKHHEKRFSVLQASQELRRVSPALISLILKGKRKVTWDRTDEIAKLLALTPHEKQYFKDWVARENGEDVPHARVFVTGENRNRRKAASSHLLSDWINVYVKDAFQLKRVKQQPQEIYAVLGGIASQKRIDKAIRFLLHSGYLRKNLDGKIVEDSPLHSVDQRIPDRKVRQFHKGSLKTALQAIEQYSAHHRYANALILPLNEKSYGELLALIAEFAEKLQGFAENTTDGDGLYQLIINLSPTGGFRE